MYSCRHFGPSALSVVRSIEVVRSSEVKNTLYIWQYRCHDASLLYGGCPFLGESVMRDFTVVHGHFYGNFTGNLAHAQSVCTRPISRREGPGDEAKREPCMISTQLTQLACA